MRLLLLLSWAAMIASLQSIPPMDFVNVTESSGVRFTSVFGSPEKTTITDVNGSGAAIIDFDRDDRADIYFVNGARTASEKGPGNVLYRNNGDGTFTNVTEKAGVADFRWGLGAASADYDNDGWPDLYVTNYGRSTLYRNRGDGTFEDVTDRAGVGKVGYSAGATFGDYDRDGRVDLFVTNYLEFDATLPEAKGLGCSYKGIPVFCGPGGFKGGANILYRNRGDGTFVDVTQQAGVAAIEPHYSFTATFEDFDLDGWPDLFVANDSTPNYLYRNLGDGRFQEIGAEAGVAFSEDGRSQASMGVAIGDYNNDGRSDIFVTNFSDDYNTLYRNEGSMFFTDQSFQAGVARPSMPMLGWGTLLEDFDNDGQQDVVVANGHIYPAVDGRPVNTTYRQFLQVFRNTDGKFTDVSELAGLHKIGKLAARTILSADFDNDGGTDLAVTQIDGPAILLSNRGRRGHWITFQLEGRTSNRSAIGASVRIKVGARQQWRTVRSGGSYISQNDLRLHFGLGAATQIDEVEITWPSGSPTKMTNVSADQIVKIAQQ